MNQNLKTASKLLDDFESFIENRSNLLVVGLKEVFPKILEWHFTIWQKETTFLGKEEKLDEWTSYSETKRFLDSIILRIEERALKIRESFAFFRHLKAHLDKHKEDYVVVNHERWYYAEKLLRLFYQRFFDTITDSPNKRDIWIRYFPKEWKVTKDNLTTEILSKITWHQFLRWAQEKIYNPIAEYDEKLDTIAENLFPEVEHTLWSKILIFLFSPYDPNRVKSVIERPWNFGCLPRIRIYDNLLDGTEGDFNSKRVEKEQKDKETERKNTFELALLIFKDHFLKRNLQKYVEELSNLEYSKDSKEEHKRMSLLDIFSGMLEFLNQQIKPANE